MKKDPASNTDAQSWGKNLLKWSMYYTACAWLWVMKQVKKNGHALADSPEAIEKVLESSGSRSKGSVYPLENAAWDEAYDEYQDKDYVPEGPHYDVAVQGMMMSAALLVPVVALVLIPVTFKPIKEISKGE